jgi:poly-gamma-glutamate synthesis protein (capsule biosynthesis protein)
LKKSDKVRISDYGYMPFWVYRFNKNGGYAYRLLPECKTKDSVCEEYKMNTEDKTAMELFFKDTKELLRNLPVINPY